MEEFSLASPRTDFHLDYNHTENLLSDFDEEISLSENENNIEEYDQLPDSRYDGILVETIHSESKDPSDGFTTGVITGFSGTIYNEMLDEEACLTRQDSFSSLNEEESVLNNV